jgi:YidC/Oxa1 family membrane protein insertase
MKMPNNPHDPQENSRLLTAIALSMIILFGFHFLYEKPRMEKMERQQQQAVEVQKKATAPTAEAPPVKSRGDAIISTKRIDIMGRKVSGSISLVGARLDDLLLNDHYTSVDKKEHVPLLSPSGTKDAYYVEGGWVSDDKNVAVPDSQTVWSIAPRSPAVLESGGAVTLQWDNGQGLLFERRIELDDNYLFTVTQKITNKTRAEKKFNAWHLISRHSLPHDFQGFFILHEGPLAVFDGKLQEPDYKDLAKGENVERDGTQGWLGITDKYWFVGIIPPGDEKFNARIIGGKADSKEFYQADLVTAAQTLAPGQAVEDKKFVFAGVKDLSLMTAYQEKYGLKNLDLTLDFGMWYLITKPFFHLLHFLMHVFGNVGLGILAMTVVVRGALFPLANKSFRSMAGMKKIAPQLKELQAKYGDNREKLQIEIFELYKKENVNPFSGCWPLLVQIPVFFALYKSILLSVELRHAPFWGWIDDLSAPDPTNIFTLFGLIPWTPPSLLSLGVWPILFCLTMIVQKNLSPPLPDPTQENLQKFFPYIITVMLAHFAAGLVIYWTWSNVLGVLQQYYILRKVGGQEVSLIRGHAERRKKKPKT